VEKRKGGGRLRSSEYGLLSAGGGREVRSRFGRHSANGRDAVAPLPAGGARERQLGWYAVPTLPEAGPTLPGGGGKGSGNGA
jgi:hypothetical protein